MQKLWRGVGGARWGAADDMLEEMQAMDMLAEQAQEEAPTQVEAPEAPQPWSSGGEVVALMARPRPKWKAMRASRGYW